MVARQAEGEAGGEVGQVGRLAAGSIFQSPLTDKVAKASIALIIAFIAIDLACKAHRLWTRITPPKFAG